MSDWPLVDLADLVEEVTVGFVGSMTKEYVDTGIPFFRSKNIKPYDLDWSDIKYVSREFHEKLKKSSLKPGDVVIVRTGKPGTACVIPEHVQEANCSDVVIARVNDRKLSPHYLSYFMNSVAAHQVGAHLVGAVQQHFNVSSAKKIKIPLPSRVEQENIVSILKSLDDKLKLNRQTNQTLEQIAQAIFKSWFVDFDPVRAKIAAREAFIQQHPEVTEAAIRAASGIEGDTLATAKACELAAMCAISGKTEEQLNDLDAETQQQLKATAALFPDALEDSELGEIPEGWKVESFQKMTKLDTTSVMPGKSPEKIWEHYSIPAFDIDESPAYEFGVDIKSNKYKVNKASILSSKLNPHFPRTWWPDIEDENAAICSTEFMQFIPHKEDQRAFIQGLILSQPFQEGIMQRVTGSTGSRQRAQPSQVSTMDVVVPSSALIDNYSLKTQELFVLKAKLIKENKKLAIVRDILLPKLLSGELNISTNKEELEQAV